MFDFDKFCEEFEKADDFTMIKGLVVRLSQATNEIEKVTIMGHLFDYVDIVARAVKCTRESGDKWAERFVEERKKNIELKKRLEEIQKAAST